MIKIMTAQEARQQTDKRINRVMSSVERAIDSAIESGEYECDVHLSDTDYAILMRHLPKDYELVKRERSGSMNYRYRLSFQLKVEIASL